MLRNFLAIVSGVLGWLALVSVGGLLMRDMWPAYAAAEPAMSFDLAMKAARLSLSSIALVLAAFLAVRIGRNSRGVSAALGIVLLIVFIPIHYQLWSKFPVWYHATFLISLIVLPLVVAVVAGKRADALTQTAG